MTDEKQFVPFLSVGNLQTFANEEPDEKETESAEDDKSEDTQDDTTESEKQGDKPTDGEPEKEAEPKFTQEDINRIVQERLDRERKRQEREENEKQRERDEENGEYKKLYETLKDELETQRKEALETKKESLLAKAGYDETQVERYKKYLDGESDEELKAALDELKADIPPKKQYGDPSTGNGHKTPPKKTNLEDKGKSAYQRLKEKGKIKGRK